MQKPLQISHWWPTWGRDRSPPPRARPQQGSQGRPPLRARPQQSQAQERPAVAGENPDAYARWRARSWPPKERGGRRDQSYSQASSDIWGPGWGESWARPRAHEWAPPPKNWWDLQAKERELPPKHLRGPENPADVFRQLAQQYIEAEVRVQL